MKPSSGRILALPYPVRDHAVLPMHKGLGSELGDEDRGDRCGQSDVAGGHEVDRAVGVVSVEGQQARRRHVGDGKFDHVVPFRVPADPGHRYSE